MAHLSSFKKKLASYSAIAGAVIACSEKSNAQIVYTDVNPDVICTTDSLFNYPFDLNNDAINDFFIQPDSSYWYQSGGHYNFRVYAGAFNNQIIGSQSQFHELASALNPGDPISSNSPWMPIAPLLMYGYFNSGYPVGEWHNSDKYLGLKLKVNGDTFYGWARLYVRSYPWHKLYTLKDYAYQSIPDSSILAGQFECDTLSAVLTPVGTIELCSGDSSILSVNQNDPYQVQWLKDGVAVAGVGNEFTVNSPGAYTAVLSGGGCSDTSNTVIVTVHPLPGAGITQSGDTLFSNPASAYQWYLNGLQIPGSTDQNFVPPQGGSYQVEITDSNGCTAISPPYDFIPTNISGASSPDVFNAFVKDHQLTIRFNSSPLPSQMILFNAVGVKLSEHTITQSEMLIDVRLFAAGIYFVVVDDGENRRVRKVVVE